MEKEFEILRCWIDHRTLPSLWLLQSDKKRMACFVEWLASVIEVRHLDVLYRDFRNDSDEVSQQGTTWIGDPFLGEENRWQSKPHENGYFYSLWCKKGNLGIALYLVSEIAVDEDFLMILLGMFRQVVWGK